MAPIADLSENVIPAPVANTVSRFARLREIFGSSSKITFLNSRIPSNSRPSFIRPVESTGSPYLYLTSFVSTNTSTFFPFPR